MTFHGLLQLRRRQLPILSQSGQLFVRVLAYACVVAARAQTPDPVAAREIARQDSEYSKLSVEKGMPAASAEYFADDGVAFAPTAVNGKKYWSSRKDFPGTLMWRPVFAAASRVSDLGYTTGPWELKSKTGERSIAFGNYVTIWSKQSSGEWKIELDIGTENPQPTEPPGNLELLPTDFAAGERPFEDAKRTLQKAQRRFLRVAHQNLGTAIIENASSDIRVCRDRSAPAASLAAARLLLGQENGKAMRQLGGSKLSNSGDLAYTYGEYSTNRANVIERGMYLTIWRINLNGDWKIVLDLQKKLPEKSD